MRQYTLQMSDALALVVETLTVIIHPPVHPIQTIVNPFHLSPEASPSGGHANQRSHAANSDGDQNFKWCMHLGRWFGIQIIVRQGGNT